MVELTNSSRFWTLAAFPETASLAEEVAHFLQDNQDLAADQECCEKGLFLAAHCIEQGMPEEAIALAALCNAYPEMQALQELHYQYHLLHYLHRKYYPKVDEEPPFVVSWDMPKDIVVEVEIGVVLLHALSTFSPYEMEQVSLLHNVLQKHKSNLQSNWVVGLCYLSLAEAWYYQREWSKAVVQAEKAYAIFEAQSHFLSVHYALQLLVSVCLADGRFEAAHQWAQKRMSLRKDEDQERVFLPEVLCLLREQQLTLVRSFPLVSSLEEGVEKVQISSTSKENYDLVESLARHIIPEYHTSWTEFHHFRFLLYGEERDLIWAIILWEQRFGQGNPQSTALLQLWCHRLLRNESQHLVDCLKKMSPPHWGAKIDLKVQALQSHVDLELLADLIDLLDKARRSYDFLGHLTAKVQSLTYRLQLLQLAEQVTNSLHPKRYFDKPEVIALAERLAPELKPTDLISWVILRNALFHCGAVEQAKTLLQTHQIELKESASRSMIWRIWLQGRSLYGVVFRLIIDLALWINLANYSSEITIHNPLPAFAMFGLLALLANCSHVIAIFIPARLPPAQYRYQYEKVVVQYPEGAQKQNKLMALHETFKWTPIKSFQGCSTSCLLPVLTFFLLYFPTHYLAEFGAFQVSGYTGFLSFMVLFFAFRLPLYTVIQFYLRWLFRRFLQPYMSEKKSQL